MTTRSWVLRAVCCALLLALAWACTPGAATQAPGVEEPRESRNPPAASAEAEAAPEPRTTHVALLDPTVLRALEPKGFGLGSVLFGSEAATTEELAGTGFSSILEVLKGDVARTKSEHPTALVSSVLGTRLFDARWLRSKEMRFELIGVFNRLDRRALYETTCGEVRFLYRLAFTTQQGGSPMSGRLPLTVNVVFLVPDDQGCDGVAREWSTPPDLDEEKVAEHLLDQGALKKDARARWKLKAVETNLQTVRIQSTAHPTLGGHIEYSLRVFHAADEKRSAFTPAAMENMPDVAALSKDAALRDELIAYLRTPEALAAIDEGTLRVPERFLATSARSVSPRGLTRGGNRPFSEVLSEKDVQGFDLSKYSSIGSPKALLRRLDGLSCVGCHQSRSIAGFHHVGNDKKTDPAWSSLVRGSSTHLIADLDRRRAYVEAVASRKKPEERRPAAEAQGQDGGFGAPCGLGDPGFASLRCGSGFTCVKLEDPDVGVCLDDQPVGGPCEVGTMLPGASPKKDYVRALERRSCGPSLGCSPNINGFPLGACAATCKDVGDSGRCIDFVDIDGLQACLRVGKEAAWCAERYVVERVDRACDAAHPCRQDFVCARTDDPEKGACVPPYFVFPLRADGYPIH
ncbi:MAG: hypothetical protein HOV80_35745 [Polyangiaceae bacterium]|nr:hypothetical protein [Polyangiaceae bacterium]